MDKPRIGFVGLGLMGHGMAKNLATKGYPLVVRAHRNRKPLEDVVAAGAKEVKTNADLARGNDIVLATGMTKGMEDSYARLEESVLSSV